VNAVRHFRPVASIVALILAAFSLTLGALLVPAAPGKTLGQSQVQARRPDPEKGKALFGQNCVNCHGLDATGEEGPNLHGVPDALGDTAVANIIRRGIPGTGMPSSYILSESDAADIVAWLRSFDSVAPPPAVGDPKKGEDVYNSSGCSTCHMIDSAGGSIGPDLSRIGAGRGPANLKARLIDPGANLPKPVGGFVDGGGWTQYLMFRAVEKDGHATEGMRVSEDSFSIVLKDAQGKLHGLRKPDLASLKKETGKSFMPSFKDALSAAQMDDLIAYLSTLKGPQ
jgi:putative heme-binding domain-containing protein